MNRLFSQATKPLDQLVHVAIGISEMGSHVGIFYRLTKSGPVSIIHLAWDHYLKNEPANTDEFPTYFWVALNVGPIRAKHLAYHCWDTFEANPKGIPYNFTDEFACFKDHVFIRSVSHAGLTCASFVVAVLADAGLMLITRTGWVQRSDDVLFFRWAIKGLRGELRGIPAARHPSDVAVAEAAAAAGAIRYRPMEVAGAATSDHCPVSFPEAVNLGEILQSLLPKGHVVPAYLTP
jgi:hypothetical protein